jgi:hypothetical protein
MDETTGEDNSNESARSRRTTVRRVWSGDDRSTETAKAGDGDEVTAAGPRTGLVN